MMRGAKRFASSESNPVPNDSVMQSKRILVGSPFHANKAKPSQQQSLQERTIAPLDMQRAELSRKHVRALNAQFASWVQTQLQNHPDELWEDGVQDYLNHASNITEKFHDIVNWLKENAAKGESSSLLVSNTALKPLVSENNKSVTAKPGIAAGGTTVSFGGSWSSEVQKNVSPQIKENDNKSTSDKPGIAPAATTASSGTSWSSGVVTNNKPLFSFGLSTSSLASQTPASSNSTLNHNPSNEEDGEDDVERPSSPSVKKTEEKGIVVVHEVKCKLYVKSTDPEAKDTWKDKGVGQLSIRCKEGFSKGTKESKPAIVVRNHVGKVVLNALLYPGIKTSMQKNSIVAIFHTSGDGDNSNSVVTRTFLIRTKTEEDRDKLAAVMQDYAPAA